jgi:hypothetical protein
MQKFFENIIQLIKNFLCEDSLESRRDLTLESETLHNFKNLRYIDGKGPAIHYYVLSS